MTKSTRTATHGPDEKCTLDFFQNTWSKGLILRPSCKCRQHILTVMENVTPCTSEEICWRFG